MNETKKMIDSINFSDRPDIDMTGEELNDIGNMSVERWGCVDWVDVAYDSYKLGVAKALLIGERM
jgi:hypothetical protein